ncbi:MAG: hypothetical protein PXX83_07840 [Candidatus Nitrosotalea sp.]|nr:hypothetical protein [Candidatus Nitrosotalea sp.]
MKILHLSIIVAIVISGLLITDAFAQNETNSTLPQNAIRTPNGGWITPLQTTGQNGSKLAIHYETGVQVSGYANPGPPPDPIFLVDNQNHIDNFSINHEILMHYIAYKRTPESKYQDLEIKLFNSNNLVLDDKKHLALGNEPRTVTWRFIPTQPGRYVLEKYDGDIHTSTTYFTVSNSTASLGSPILASPLRQIQAQIPLQDIRCGNNLELVVNENDHSAACVTQKAAIKLEERGWDGLGLYLDRVTPHSPDISTIIQKGANPDSAKFEPGNLGIVIGINNTVKWTSQTLFSGTLFADNQTDLNFYRAGRQVIEPDKPFEFTFTEPGVFRYHGEPWESGTVTVSSGNTTQPSRYQQLTVTGLNDSYKVGQPIEFNTEMKGYGTVCRNPQLSISYTDGTELWTGPETVTVCDPGMGDFDINYDVSQLGGPVVLNQTGSYGIMVEYGADTVFKKINVVN